MVQRIAVGNEIVEFPDGMSDTEIKDILKTKYKPVEAPTSGIAMGLKDPISAGAQMLPRGLAYLTSLGGLAPNKVSEFLQSEAERVDKMVKAEENQYQAQRRAAGETGMDWGRIGGNVLNPVNYVGGAPTTIPRLLTMGAAQGMLAPVYDTDQFGYAKLAQAGEGATAAGLFGLGSKLIRGAGNTVSDIVAPFTEKGQQRLAREFVQKTVPEEYVPQVQAVLRNPNVYVEGSIPTMGEAVAGIPQATNLAALQARMATSKEVAPMYAAREAERELARANAVAKLGGEFVPEAEKARTALTAPMREEALAAAKPVQAESLASAIETVADSKKYKGSGLAEDSLKYFANAFREAATDGVVTPEAMYNIRKRVGQEIQGLASQKGISSLDATAIAADSSIKKIIDNAIEATGGKGWKDYLTAFEQESTKINRMQVGQYLQDAMKKEFKAENAGAFVTAFENAAQTIKKSTGVSRYNQLSDFMPKEEIKLLSGVNADLLRSKTYKELAAKSTQGTKFADGEAIPHFLNRTATITNYALKKFNKDADAKINQYLAGLDNEKWAALFDAIPPNKAQVWVNSIFPRLTPEVQDKVFNTLGLGKRAVGLTGTEALYRESGKPPQYIQQETPTQPVSVQPQSKSEVVNTIVQTAQQKGAGQYAGIITGIAKVESGFDTQAKNKKSTAAGLFQMTKAAQKDYGVSNPYDARQSAAGATDYFLKMMKRYNGDVVKALAAYNQGPGVIDKGLNKAGREYAMKVINASRGG